MDEKITSPAQTERILERPAYYPLEVPNVQAGTLQESRLLRPGFSSEAQQLINLRLDGAHAAVTKLATLRRWLGATLLRLCK